MPKYACTCGYVMNLSKGWSDYELALVPESIIGKIGDSLDSGAELSSEQLYEAIDEKAVTVYQCPNCRRLHLEEETNKFITYVVE